MKKIVCSFVFGLMLMVAGAQAWAEYPGPIPPPNPKAAVTSTEYPGPIPPPNPKVTRTLQAR